MVNAKRWPALTTSSKATLLSSASTRFSNLRPDGYLFSSGNRVFEITRFQEGARGDVRSLRIDARVPSNPAISVAFDGEAYTVYCKHVSNAGQTGQVWVTRGGQTNRVIGDEESAAHKLATAIANTLNTKLGGDIRRRSSELADVIKAIRDNVLTPVKDTPENAELLSRIENAARGQAGIVPRTDNVAHLRFGEHEAYAWSDGANVKHTQGLFNNEFHFFRLDGKTVVVTRTSDYRDVHLADGNERLAALRALKAILESAARLNAGARERTAVLLAAVEKNLAKLS